MTGQLADPVTGAGGETSGDAAPPAFPYRTSDGEATEGWSGSATSHERAQHAKDTASARQRYVVDLVSERGRTGMTWREVGRSTGWHHGQVSGILSVLHQVGQLERLTIRRERCEVYVVPEFVAGRPVSPFKHNKSARVTPLTDREREALDRAVEATDTSLWACLEVDDLETLLAYIKRASGAT